MNLQEWSKVQSYDDQYIFSFCFLLKHQACIVYNDGDRFSIFIFANQHFVSLFHICTPFATGHSNTKYIVSIKLTEDTKMQDVLLIIRKLNWVPTCTIDRLWYRGADIIPIIPLVEFGWGWCWRWNSVSVGVQALATYAVNKTTAHCILHTLPLCWNHSCITGFAICVCFLCNTNFTIMLWLCLHVHVNTFATEPQPSHHFLSGYPLLSSSIIFLLHKLLLLFQVLNRQPFWSKGKCERCSTLLELDTAYLLLNLK